MAVLGCLCKLKECGTSFWCTFFVSFSHKTVPYLILYQWTKFQCHTFPSSQYIKQNALSSSYLAADDVISFKIYLEQPLKQWLTGRKRGEDGNRKN